MALFFAANLVGVEDIVIVSVSGLTLPRSIVTVEEMVMVSADGALAFAANL